MPPSYYEYMASEAWREKRRQRLEIDSHRCRTCGHNGDVRRLTVHHITYQRLGNEDVENDLITLCESCHEAITDAMRRQRYAARHLTVEFEPIVTIVTRTETSYGMASTNVQVDFYERSVAAQRADGKPAKQVGKVDETDFIQARQDRRGL